jgi:hypothetical protein
MKTIHLFRFNDSIFRKIPFFKEEHRLKTDVTEIDLMNIEIVTEYIVKTHDDFSLTIHQEMIFYQCAKKLKKQLNITLCRVNGYDVI